MTAETKWMVTLSDDAINDLEKLIYGIGRRRVKKVMDKLMDTLKNLDKNRHKIKPIRGMDAYKLRIGKFRAAFRIKKKERIVEVFAIGFRESFYEKL